LWILAPASFGIVLLGEAITSRGRLTPRSRNAAAAVVACMSGSLNPQGLGSFLLPFTFSKSTASIVEWNATTFDQLPSLALLALVALAVLAWARGSARVGATEILWAASWSCFAVLAYRNVAPALLMLAPAAAQALDRTFGEVTARQVTPGSRREGIVVSAAVLLVVVGSLVTSVGRLVRLEPLRDLPAAAIGRWLSTQEQPMRIFDFYNSAGALIALGGRNARLAVDGRADLWGPSYLDQVIEAEQLAPGWDRTLNAFRPDALVLGFKAPLTQHLLAEGTWRVALRDHRYVLLLPTRGGNPGG
jgi:hypothetical protein